MDNIKSALTRKFGPLPAWAWLLAIFAGVWWYRHKYGSTASTVSTSATSGGDTSGTGDTNPPTVLEPGESVYDSGTGTLTTAPGGTDTSGTGSSSGSGTGTTGDGSSTISITGLGGFTKSLNNLTKLLQKEQKRTPKPKKTNKPHTPKTGKPKNGTKGRGRSTTAIKNKIHSAGEGKKGPEKTVKRNRPEKGVKSRATGGVGLGARGARTRARTPVTTNQLRAHPATGMQARRTEPATVQHRPSNPPARKAPRSRTKR